MAGLGVAATVGLAGCSSSQAQETSQPPNGWLSIVKVETVRQHSQVGVRMLVENGHPKSRKSSCADVALFRGDSRAFSAETTVAAPSESSEWNVVWWDVEPDVADQEFDGSAELESLSCGDSSE